MLDKKLLHLEWIKFAETDLSAARELFSKDDSFLNIVAFLSQQGCEKAIKACLIKLEIKHRKIHDLHSLLSLLEDQPFFTSKLYDAIDVFEKFNVEIRYPDADIFPTKKEAEIAIDASEFIISFIKENIKD